MTNTASPLEDLSQALRPWLERYGLEVPQGCGDATAASNALFTLAARTGADAFVLDPRPRHLELSLQLEGSARAVGCLPKRHQASLTATLKAMASLDVGELRLPQDGRVRVRLMNADQEVQVSVLPATWGERVACRFRDLATPPGLDELGLDQSVRDRVAERLSRPRGLFVVAGPRLEDRHLAIATTFRVAVSGGRPGVVVSARPPAGVQEWATTVRLRPRLGLDQGAALWAAYRGGASVVVADEPRDPEDLRALAGIVRDGVMGILAVAEADVAGSLEALEEACGVAPALRREFLGVLAVTTRTRTCSHCAGQPGTVEDCPDCFGAGVRGRLRSAEAHIPWG